MLVCICNALSERKVHHALRAGARTAEGVYAHHDCKVECGKCLPAMRALVDAYITVADRRAPGDDGDALAAAAE
jgi:bacterioferritin-associated ferredoxin